MSENAKTMFACLVAPPAQVWVNVPHAPAVAFSPTAPMYPPPYPLSVVYWPAKPTVSTEALAQPEPPGFVAVSWA